MKGLILAISIIFFAPDVLFASETSPSTGFMDGPVWTDSSIEIGEKIKLYGAIFNGEKSRVDFVVEFFDGSTSLGKSEVSIWPKEAKATSIDWMVDAGRHNISAKIISAKIDTTILDINKTEAKKMSFNAVEDAKETPIVVAEEDVSEKNNSTQLSDLVAKINFKKGSFGDKSKIFVIDSVDKIDSWRSLTKAHLVESVEKIKDSRKDITNMKPEVKTMSFLHLWLIQILKFIFSIGTLFYGLGIVLAIILIRKFFAFLGWLFRKRPEMA